MSGPVESTQQNLKMLRTRARPFWWGVAIIAALIVVAAAMFIRSRKTPGESRPPTAARDGMAGMPGIAAGSGKGAVGSVELSPSQMRELGITFGIVERRTLTDEVRTIGTVSVNEARVAQLAPKFAGFAERLHVDFTGAFVVRGQPMIELYSPEITAAEQELLSAAEIGRAMRAPAVPGVPSSSTDLLAAGRTRLRLWDVPDAEIDEVLRTNRARRTVTLYAPMSGIVTEKNVVRGQAVTMGQSLYTIADLSEVWVMADVREADAARVRIGAGADVELASMPGRMWKGRVTYLYPTLDAQTRAVRARIVVANAGGLLKPGMYATVRLSSPSREALTVSSSAIVRTGERSLVFVDAGSGRLAPRVITLGRSAGDLTEVLGGLKAGERVLTSAQFLVSSESNLAEVMRGMIAQTGAGGAANSQDMKGMPGMQNGGATPNALKEKGADMRGMKGMPAASPSTAPEKKP